MKNIFLGLTLVLTAVSCNAQNKEKANQTQASEAKITNLKPAEFLAKTKANPGIIVDVRTPEEVAQGHLANASFIDFYADDFATKAAMVNKNSPVYVYCRSGGRSANAAEIFAKTGHKEVYNLEGGITAWGNNGLEIIKTTDKKPATVHEIDVNAIDAAIKSNKTVLLDFGTKWCLPCKKMEPVISEIKKEMMSKAEVFIIDADKYKELSKKYNVESVPTYIVFKNGKQTYKTVGLTEKSILVTQLQK